MKFPVLVAVLAFVVASALPAAAQTPEEQRQQLEAQKAINEQLRQRVQELERALSGAPAPPALQPLETQPALREPETPESTTAIREALIAKGFVLLPPGSFRLIPGISWTHAGAEATRNRSDTFTGSLSGFAGLPWRMQLNARVPYVFRDTSVGSNDGWDDLSVGLSKQIASESDTLPSLIASLTYLDNNGKDPFAPVPIGYGFRVVSGTVSALKRFDPVALFGDLSYSYVFARDVKASNFLGESHFDGRIEPGASYGYRLGVSLAATPGITVDASVFGAFVERTDVHSEASGNFSLSSSTIVFMNLGSGFLLTRNLSLLLTASAGVTEDSPDFIFSASLPYRF